MNTRWQDFRVSISSRNGLDVFYSPRYYNDSQDGLQIKFPWWVFITRFVTSWLERFYLIGRVLSPRGGWMAYEDDYGFGCWDKDITPWQRIRRRFWMRLFYVTKACLCILWPFPQSSKRWWEAIEVASFNFGPAGGEYGGDAWESISVGCGIFTNWFYRDYSDSSC